MILQVGLHFTDTDFLEIMVFWHCPTAGCTSPNIPWTEMTPMPVIQRFYERLGSGRIVLVFGLLYAFNQALIGTILSPLGHGDVLTLQLTFNPQTFSNILEHWGPEGIRTYLLHFLPDYIHGPIYAVFLSSAMARLTKDRHPPASRFVISLFLLPFIAGLCDMAENTLHLIMIGRPALISSGLVSLSAACTWIKWILAAVSLLAILFFIIRKVTTHENRNV